MAEEQSESSHAPKYPPFLSYARSDSNFALQLVKDLRTAGNIIWLDQLDISPGQRWDQSVEDALTNCRIFVVILSPASVASANVMDEVSFALEQGKTVVPVLYRDCTIPFRLRRLQYLDFRTNYETGLRKLLKTLNNELGAERPLKPQSIVQSSDGKDTATKPVAYRWRSLLWKAIAALALALLAFFQPAMPFGAELVIFLGICFLAEGAILIRHGKDTKQAALSFLAGLMLLFRFSHFHAVVDWIAFGAIGAALLTFGVDVLFRRRMPDEALLLFAAAASFLWGVIELSGPALEFWNKTWLVPLYALTQGILLLVLSIRFKSRHEQRTEQMQ